MQHLKLLVITLAATLSACGGGGGGTANQAADAIQKTYTSSATAGEVLKYTVDTTALTYSYEILQSAYGLLGNTGSGTLTKNSDGTYSPSESPSSKILPLKNGLLLGNVKLTMSGTSRDVPILGMENPATTSNDLAGTYNFITVQCATKSNGIYTNCFTYYGTVEVTASTSTTATFRSCVGADITTGTGSCTSTRSGTLTYLANGVWAMKDSASTFNNYMLAFQAPNGQKVGWLDFNDATVFGYGQGVVSQRTTLNTYAGIDGSYFYKNTAGTSGSVTLSANAGTQQITGSSGIVVTGNQPWAGFGKSATGYGLMAGNGIYVYMDRAISNSYYEIGIQK